MRSSEHSSTSSITMQLSERLSTSSINSVLSENDSTASLKSCLKKQSEYRDRRKGFDSVSSVAFGRVKVPEDRHSMSVDEFETQRYKGLDILIPSIAMDDEGVHDDLCQTLSEIKKIRDGSLQDMSFVKKRPSMDSTIPSIAMDDEGADDELLRQTLSQIRKIRDGSLQEISFDGERPSI